MKTSKWLIITLAAALTAGGFIAYNAHAAEKNAAPQRPFRGRLLERAKEKLGLTDEQAVQIKAVLKSEKDNITSLLTRLQDAHAGLREAIQSSDATEASVRVAAAKVAAVEADMAVERLKLHGKISPMLTAEQQAKISEFHSRVDEFMDGAIDRIGKRLAE
jgi:Spy/CpxP family protein refolding chaperone